MTAVAQLYALLRWYMIWVGKIVLIEGIIDVHISSTNIRTGGKYVNATIEHLTQDGLTG
jgi:hypothetical protein